MHAKMLVAIAAGLLATISIAHAQMDQLKGIVGGAGGNASLPSVSQASPSNLAGVLQYCVKNNMLGGDASSVSSSLVSKTGGQDSAFQSGSQGNLSTGGDTYSLAGAGMKEQIAQKVCGLVLDRAKSLL